MNHFKRQIHHDGGEQSTVDTVKHPTMSGHNVAHVLDVGFTLDAAFYQIAKRRGYCAEKSDNDKYGQPYPHVDILSNKDGVIDKVQRNA